MVEFLAGFGVSLALVVSLWMIKPKRAHSARSVNLYTSIDEIRSVGELVVYKVKAKEIVTTAEHWFGDVGKKYFKWLCFF